MKAVIYGINGKMGKIMANNLLNDSRFKRIEGIEPNGKELQNAVPTYLNLDEVNLPDVIIDFSHPSQITKILDYGLKNNVPLVIATTGFNDLQISLIKEASEKIPIFFSSNFSIGVYILNKLVKNIVEISNDFDIEIIEKHHNQKVDVPSGTALTLLNTIKASSKKQYSTKIGRNENNKKRDPNEITIHSIRGGSIVGEHSVLFMADDELIELTHQAHSKSIFANGAKSAALFIVKQEPGLYFMDDLFNRNGEDE